MPARVYIEHRLDETVACPSDDTIVSAPPPAIVERGKLGDTLIVEATCDKYIEYQPIERQCVRYARAGIEIAPQTLGRSVGAHIDLLMPVAALIAEQTRAPGYLGTDATGIPVLDPSVRDGIRTGAMWAWTNARWVSFFYSAHGDAQSVRDFLGDDLARNVQCDGTSVTNCTEQAGSKRPGCMSHGRRRFVEAARSGDPLALEGVRLIAPLFEIERVSKFAGDTAKQRLARRIEHSKPIVDKLRTWLDEHRGLTPPETPFGRALGYLHRQCKRLTLFLEDGNIELTNNRRERELRRLVLGRSNHLFVGHQESGHDHAVLYTLVASCEKNGVNPVAYLTDVLTRVQTHPASRNLELLPHRWKPPDPQPPTSPPATA